MKKVLAAGWVFVCLGIFSASSVFAQTTTNHPAGQTGRNTPELPRQQTQNRLESAGQQTQNTLQNAGEGAKNTLENTGNEAKTSLEDTGTGIKDRLESAGRVPYRALRRFFTGE